MCFDFHYLGIYFVTKRGRVVTSFFIPFRYTVSFCPALPQESDIVNFLKTLGIDWPTVPVSWTNEDREEKMKKALENSTYRDREMERGKRRSRGEEIEGEKRGIKEEVRINLKQVVQDENLQGYDPSLGTCTGEL